MFNLEEAKRIINDAPEIIDLLENDLAIAKDAGLSTHSINAIESLIHRHTSMIKEAELSIKFIDYQ